MAGDDGTSALDKKAGVDATAPADGVTAAEKLYSRMTFTLYATARTNGTFNSPTA
jgi:hypothetical protein